MKIKSKLSVVAVFSCCALASIGFASWVITQGPLSVTGSISADKVVYSNDYFYMDGDPCGLDCTYKGFREPDEPDKPYKDTLITNYVIDLDKCYEMYGERTITATINLYYSTRVSTSNTTNIFRPNNQKYIESKVTAIGIDISPFSISSTSITTNNADYAYTITFEFTISETTNGKATIAVDYTFNFYAGLDETAEDYESSAKTNFENFIYTPLKTVARTFVFDARLKGG